LLGLWPLEVYLLKQNAWKSNCSSFQGFRSMELLQVFVSRVHERHTAGCQSRPGAKFRRCAWLWAFICMSLWQPMSSCMYQCVWCGVLRACFLRWLLQAALRTLIPGCLKPYNLWAWSYNIYFSLSGPAIICLCNMSGLLPCKRHCIYIKKFQEKFDKPTKKIYFEIHHFRRATNTQSKLLHHITTSERVLATMHALGRPKTTLQSSYLL
jgi:hypothetical protein